MLLFLSTIFSVWFSVYYLCFSINCSNKTLCFILLTIIQEHPQRRILQFLILLAYHQLKGVRVQMKAKAYQLWTISLAIKPMMEIKITHQIVRNQLVIIRVQVVLQMLIQEHLQRRRLQFPLLLTYHQLKGVRVQMKAKAYQLWTISLANKPMMEVKITHQIVRNHLVIVGVQVVLQVVISQYDIFFVVFCVLNSTNKNMVLHFINNNTGTPTEKKTTVPYIADVPPVEGDLSSTSAVSQKEPPNEEIEKQKMSKKEEVELIGPTATQTVLEEKTGILGGGVKPLVIVVLVALVAIVGQYYLRSKSPPQKTDWQQVDVFLKQMKKVKARFPNQRDELWSRSEIHLKRHLQTSQPTEPVSLILTSGVRAERTMRCLAQGVASAFSTARNASVLHIDGAGKAGQDSDQVKLDIDRKLQGAFEGDKPVAVIHRLEELPPGSTLIFYRYCDHENAAYKKTFLIFTVLLGDEEEIPAEMRLSVVEEMVDDYLQKRFLSHDHPVSFDRMDLNKYGGLWSRISHLILPVAAEDRIEQEGC
uniref:Torsin-1A-interacting protein 2-like n=1 Tax=Poecilia latipinna TaxID=48699 RepID=A0A3B3ULK5_9TELE